LKYIRNGETKTMHLFYECTAKNGGKLQLAAATLSSDCVVPWPARWVRAKKKQGTKTEQHGLR